MSITILCQGWALPGPEYWVAGEDHNSVTLVTSAPHPMALPLPPWPMMLILVVLGCAFPSLLNLGGGVLEAWPMMLSPTTGTDWNMLAQSAGRLSLVHFFLSSFFWPHRAACGISVP